ncbi:UNVERIFIED_CONTAM: putative protein ycf45 [Sesamum angustifolium]|uniref:Uncharacterized protein n=1 Tax=Sesamum angustifolium TaxID=2727405 RepID=A0AAW2IMJ6_9LAMI
MLLKCTCSCRSLAWEGTNSHNCGLIISSIKTNSTKEISNHDQVTLDLGRLPQACYLGDSGKRDLRKKEVSIEELEYAQNALGEFGGNNRTGIAGTLHRISAIRNKNGRVVGLTCRLGRPVREIIDMTRDLLEYGKSILFLGRPGVGKTRVIRGISHVLSYELLKRVAIINQKNSNSHGGDIAAVLLLHFFCLLPLLLLLCSCCCVLLLLLLHFASADAAAALLLSVPLLRFALLQLLLLRFATAAAAFCYACGCILLLLQFASWKQPHGSDGVLRIGSLHYSSSSFLHLNVTEMYLLLQFTCLGRNEFTTVG